LIRINIGEIAMNRFRQVVFLTGSMALSNLALAATTASQLPDPLANIFSASATITSGSTEVALAEIPQGQSFILTQYCRSGGGAGFGPELRGSAFGVIPSGVSEGGCTTYSPGILLRGGQSILCASAFPVFDSASCMITGYKLK
jgi:outer membrane receptor protein involved in Fe transport